MVPLVVRALGDAYEVLSGNQRLHVLRDQGTATVPCVEVQADDTRARLLTQALNAIHGEDDINRKAAVVKEILAAMPAEEVATLLPETADALRGLASIGQTPPSALGGQLAAWSETQQARAAAKLHVTSFPFSDEQKEIVEEAVSRALPRLTGVEAPNRRALALVAICDDWIHGHGFSKDRSAREHPKRKSVVSATATQPSREQGE